MGTLPTGTVTFLFTDIEGSTALWERQPQAMRAALLRHDAIVEGAVERHEGTIVRPRGEGDSRFAVFARATDAVTSATAMQRAFHTESWPTPTPLQVRMALHTGEADLREGDYYGAAVNRCARLRAIAHGGQVLLSQTTCDLVRGALPGGASLRDLGEHRLRDLIEPERVFQLLHPDLPAAFPPLTSLDAYPHNLPVQLTSFIGREREMAEVKGLLERTRLLTLTGLGGSGKTRLALQVAADVIEAHADGVWLVDLAPLADPALVPQAVAGVLGVREVPGQPLPTTLLHTLRPKRLLLVLDNCEHLVDACARLADTLLRGCPNVQILTTGREALGIAGETAWRVPSLSLPDAQRLPSLAELTQAEAVRLFMARALAVQPRFAVTAQNAPAVAQVCWRLDGLPLAIELAAARVQALTVEQIARRLDDRFRLLTGGSRTALPRQQTLRATIDWSYGLLSAPEQALFRRLSVFAGGWTLEAAEAVCAGEGVRLEEILDLLARLVAKSLALAEERGDGTARYRPLETVRQYARDRLVETGEAAGVRERHRDWCLALVEQAEPEGAEQLSWLARLEAEHDNLRAALAWCLDDDPRVGARLAAGLWPFWQVRSYSAEGRRWLDSLLARAPERTLWRVKALHGAGTLALDQGDYSMARARFEEGLALSRELGDTRFIAVMLRELGQLFTYAGDYGQARVLLEEGLALVRDVGDQRDLAASLMPLGGVAVVEGDYRRARALWEEGLAVLRAVGDRYRVAFALAGLARLSLIQGDQRRAQALGEEGLAVAQAIGSPGMTSEVRIYLGQLAHWQGDLERATAQYQASLAVARDVGDSSMIAHNLTLLGRVAQQQGDAGRATALLQESLALFTTHGTKLRMSEALHGLGLVAWSQGDPARASSLLRQSLALRQELGNRLGLAEGLEGLAMVAVGQRQPTRGARLLGAAEALREAVGAPLPPVERSSHEAMVQAARADLGERLFADAWAAGEALPLEQAVAEALADDAEV